MYNVCLNNMMNFFKPENKYHSQHYKGWYISIHGYKLIYKPSHPDARPDGYIFEHRLVMEQKLGRRLLKKEKVHHLDHDKLNNTPNNLIILSNSDHMKEHKPWKIWGKQSKTGKKVKCKVCNKIHYRKGYSLKRSKNYFCSIKCYFSYRKQKL